MRAKRRKLKLYLCKKCGKQLSITVPPYLREGLRKNNAICECDRDFYFRKPRWTGEK